jgi:hypothetical protein
LPKNDIEQHPDDFANAFESAFARLQIRIETVCVAETEWSAQVAAGIRAALAFAAAVPAAARVLTSEALAMLVAQRLDMGREAELPGLASEAIQFVFTPYLGMEEARRVAAAPS